MLRCEAQLCHGLGIALLSLVGRQRAIDVGAAGARRVVFGVHRRVEVVDVQVGRAGSDGAAHVRPFVRQFVAYLVLQVEVVDVGVRAAPVAAEVSSHVLAVASLDGAVAEDVCAAVAGRDVGRGALVAIAADGQVAVVEHDVAAAEDVVGVTDDVTVLHIEFAAAVERVL